MFCTKCGVKLQDKANFCSKCGHPIGAVPSKPSVVEYDICVLGYRTVGWTGLQWEARVGDTVVARGQQYKAGGSVEKQNLQDAVERATLVAVLMSQGWEAVTSDQFGGVVTMRKAKR